MSWLPSTSQARAPSARSMTRGVPPTERNARTGELTAPGKRRSARAISSIERVGAAVSLIRQPHWRYPNRSVRGRPPRRHSSAYRHLHWRMKGGRTPAGTQTWIAPTRLANEGMAPSYATPGQETQDVAQWPMDSGDDRRVADGRTAGLRLAQVADEVLEGDEVIGL